jgi:hypothetical protein
MIDVYVVYISQFDIFKGNSPIYHIDKVVRETGEIIDDGSHAVFVNTAVDNGSTVSELMACFLQKSVDNPNFPRLSSRVKELKSTERGAGVVCEVMERYQEKAVREAGIKTTVKMAVKFNASKEQAIEQLMTDYQLTETEAIQQYEKYAPTLA